MSKRSKNTAKTVAALLTLALSIEAPKCKNRKERELVRERLLEDYSTLRECFRQKKV